MDSSIASSTVSAHFDALMKSGELVDEAVFCQRSGLSLEQVAAAIAAGRLFRLESGNSCGYPAFFLDAFVQRAQVEAITQLLARSSAGTKYAFFTTPRGSLARSGRIQDGVLVANGTARTPLQALRDGELERVRAAALSASEG